MKKGLTINQFAAEIMRQNQAKRDFVVPVSKLLMTGTGDERRLSFGDQSLAIGDIAHRQIAEYCGIPAKYYDRMAADAPDLLITSVNRWLAEHSEDKRMIRTLDGKARALLSDSFNPLDNNDLTLTLLPVLMDMGVDIASTEITERKLYIKVIDKNVRREVANLGEGHMRAKTRMLYASTTISNSEIGFGSLSIQGGIFDEFCTNMSVFKERSMRRAHIGSKIDIGEGELYAMLSDETKRADQQATWLKARDVVKGVFDRAKFDALVDKIEATQGEKVEAKATPEIVEVTAKKFGMTENEKGSVLDHLIKGGDFSRFGLYNAVTRTAEDIDSYDRATEFEKFGGDIIDLPQSEWRVIADGNVKALKLAA